MITMPMAGCFGGDDDDSSDTSEPELNDWNVHFAATAADLPTCDEDTNGRLYYVETDGQFQVCKTSGWSIIDIQGADGQDGADGVQGPAGADGQDGAPGSDGQDGADGTQGPAGADGQDGADGAQGSAGADGQDGAQGPQGPAGDDGADGQDGDDGEDGTSILITTSSSTSCTNGGNTFNIGPDSNSNGFLEASEVVMNVDICNGAEGPQGPQGPAGNDGVDGNDGAQGPQGPAGNDGADGQDGADGNDGAQGPQGPAGNDGADGQDGAPGADGQDGAQGPQGPAGNDGSTALIATSTEPAGTNCANGGVKIEAGVDDNGNGQLDSNEVDSTQYICDGGSSATTMLTSYSTPPTSMGCDVGGRVISHGLDNGDGSGTAANGQLENGEIDYSTTLCTKLGSFLVKENPEPGLSTIRSVYSKPAVMGNTVYFTSYDSTNGYALWKSDGTIGGTGMVKDTYTGSSLSSSFAPDELTVIGNTLFFEGYDATNGYTLWKSDGTTAGTVIVKDTDPSSTSNGPNQLTVVGNTLFFEGYDSTNAYALWKSDGTTAGTVMVKDTHPGSSVNSYYGPRYLTAVGNTLFFNGYDSTNAYALWKSDGTTAGTVMVKDTSSSTSSIHGPNSLTAVGNTLFFAGYDSTNGFALWKSDGTTAGTVMVKDTYTGSSLTSQYSPFYLTAVGNTLFFQGYDITYGKALWKSDGTTAGTVRVKDIYTSGTGNGPIYLTAIGNTLFFQGYDATNGYGLWKSDGTTAGTVMVKDTDPSSTSNGPNQLTVVGNTLFFAGYDSTNGFALWKSDGTTAGTVMVKDIYTGSSLSSSYGVLYYLTAVGNTLFFEGYDSTNAYALWKSDGTTAGTVMVKDIDTAVSSTSYFGGTAAIGNTLFFAGYDLTNGWALWKSDGTTAGTVMLKDINAGADNLISYAPYQLTAVGNTLFFNGYDAINGYALWKSDGTTAGTVMVKDTYTGSSTAFGFGPNSLTAVGNTLFFRGYDSTNAYALWKSDGTTAGTVMVKDTYTGSSGSSSYGPKYLTAVGNTLFFNGYDSTNKYALWKSDGTTAGTVMVKDTYTEISTFSLTSYGPYQPTAIGNTLFFQGYDATNGYALWKSDGTTAGTVMVKDTDPSITNSNLNQLTVVGNTLFFQGYDATNGYALWKSDGTTAGTVMVKDIYTGSSLSSSYGLDYLTAVGNTLFFSGYDSTNGYALWKSDGTTAGTVMVKDTYTSSTEYGPDQLTAVGNTLFFEGFDQVNGYALWKSDGTTAGTVMVKDTYTSSNSNGPDQLTAVGNTLFFEGYDQVNGYSLWKIEEFTEITYS